MEKETKYVLSILKEALRHPAIIVDENENGTIRLYFDGCCSFDIEIKNYVDLREWTGDERGQ